MWTVAISGIKAWLETRKEQGKSNTPIYVGAVVAVLSPVIALVVIVALVVTALSGAGSTTVQAGNDHVAQQQASDDLKDISAEGLDDDLWGAINTQATLSGVNPYILGAIAFDKQHNQRAGSGIFGLDTGTSSASTGPTASGDTPDAADVSGSDAFMADKVNSHDIKSIYLAVKTKWPQITSMGGHSDRSGGPNPDSDHNTGKAIDIMIPDYASESGKKLGDEVAEFFASRAKNYGATYLIWRNQIRMTTGKNTDWAPYDSGPFKDAIAGLKKGGVTKAEQDQIDNYQHMNHVHVSVEGNSGTAPATPGGKGSSAEGSASEPASSPSGQKTKPGKVPEAVAESPETSLAYVGEKLHDSQAQHISSATPEMGSGFKTTTNLSTRKRDPSAGAKANLDAAKKAWVDTVKTLPLADASSRAEDIVETAIRWTGGEEAPQLADDTQAQAGMACSTGGDEFFYMQPPRPGSSGPWSKVVFTDKVKEHPDWVEEWKKAGEVSGIDWKLLATQAYVESKFDPNAGSPAGAQGLTQFMPGTWPSYGEGSVTDPIQNIRAQGKYMAEIFTMMKKYAGGDNTKALRLAFAGYNSGPYLPSYKSGEIPPIRETQNYPKQIMDGKDVKCDELQLAGDFTMDDLGAGEWSNPLPGSMITSPWGPRGSPVCGNGMTFHEGIDIAGGGSKYFYAPTDLIITAVHQSGTGPAGSAEGVFGTYLYAKQDGGEGLGFEFHENKPNSLRVSVGDHVKRGTALGEVGMSGSGSFGVHVHFQIDKPGTDMSAGRINNCHSINPVTVLGKKGVKF